MKLINKNKYRVFGMYKKAIATMVFVVLSVAIFAQDHGVGIGTLTPHASAILDVTATNKGLLLPRVANTAAIAAPVNGLVIYDISTNCVKVYQDNAWSNCFEKPALTVAEIVAISNNPAADDSPSLLDLANIGLVGAIGSQTEYEEAIAAAAPAPTTLAQLQTIIDMVNNPVISSLDNCTTPTIVGILANDTEATGITFTINYSGGNGGVYKGEVVSSTGILGVTATLASGTLENGAGSVTYNLSGKAQGEGIANFAISVVGQPCTVSIAIDCEHLTTPGTLIKDVTSTVTGRVWMDRNLGAIKVASSSTDADSYGGLYQWGRNTDGHEAPGSCSELGPVSITVVDGTGYYKYVLVSSATSFSGDWMAIRRDTRWNTAGFGATPEKTINDPCPRGYRVPTYTELNAEVAGWPTKNAAGAFASVLKLPLAGKRKRSSGVLENVGTNGHYWTSTPTSTSSINLQIANTNANFPPEKRASGASVRCIKEE